MLRYHWPDLSLSAQSELLRRHALASDSRAAVKDIMAAVAKHGDSAVRDYTEKFDGIRLKAFELAPELFALPPADLSADTWNALSTASDRIKAFHQLQCVRDYEVELGAGIICGRRAVPHARVAVYVPGGTAPLPSTVLMTVIPAIIAGCPEVLVLTPPQPYGVPPVILAAAQIAGAHRLFTLGGAQAIAAVAFGTETVPRVDKIVGPGNSWVTAAKLEASLTPGGPAIDLPAGPSELMVLGDGTVPPAFIAWDLLAQAEHGVDSQVLLVTTSPAEADAVWQEVMKNIENLPRAGLAKKALARSALITCVDADSAVAIVNSYAPEHLIIARADADTILPQIKHAGSIFCGPWSPESVGDYAAGTNHVLPTGGSARSYSGLGVQDFVRFQTYQRLDRAGLAALAPTVITLAETEGLHAHAMAVKIRLDVGAHL